MFSGKFFTNSDIAHMESSFDSSECLDFIAEHLIDMEENELAKDVLTRMVNVGYDKLSEKQKNVVRISFQRHLRKCERCEEFLWEEADFIIEHGLCSSCQNTWDKD